MKIEKQDNNKNHRGNPHWVKGQSGNPNGRPRKEISLTSQLKSELLKIAPFKGNTDKKTWLELIVIAWMAGAAKGNAPLLKELIERIDGKVPDQTWITGREGQPIQVEDARNKLAERLDTIAAVREAQRIVVEPQQQRS